jgi:hypothetical protein
MQKKIAQGATQWGGAMGRARSWEDNFSIKIIELRSTEMTFSQQRT